MNSQFKTTLILLLFTVVTCLSGTAVTAASNKAVKARMKERLPAIMALKDKGVIGENNRGYLEFRTASPPDQKLIQQENADRNTAYQAIARQQGASIDIVEQSGARSIAERGKQGHWFQKPDGTWFKK